MKISDNIEIVLKQIPSDVKLLAVSKKQPVKRIFEAYYAGQRIFGENRVQELIEKQPHLPSDIEWHMIGHLQTNKVKYIAPFISCIHSVDSLKLLTEINKEALKNNRMIDCLFEFHIASEESKFGLSINDAHEIMTSEDFIKMKNIRICGVMGMASFVDDEKIVRNEFKTLKRCFDELKLTYFTNVVTFQEISMGMSSDFKIAIEEGSTIVRVGTAIFGERNYQ
ncbi:MAG: YggS family pyridoxal phosphate-dependent enzyme [Bacteroidales bacterium]|jgi:hypothetical protein|nr:YggS family pyridoxal phosphate-dependent enzyme [Bacteroidales bacterium]MDD4214640.1 YggS family pyridoxal phosphate-dependent enzyme [Bacteroidales bacterium]